MQGVPADGVIDTGADIVIMGKELFARVAATERLHKKSLGSQTECHRLMTKEIHLDECMDMDLSFADKTTRTCS